MDGANGSSYAPCRSRLDETIFASALASSFIEAGDLLRSEFVTQCERVLVHDHRIGLVSSWGLDLTRGKLWSRPSPYFPFQTIWFRLPR